jgi:hypothetical protein
MPNEPIQLDWKGLTYDEIDGRIHDLAGVPHDKKFVDMNARPFRGTVPKAKESKVFDVIEYAQRSRQTRREIESTYKYFRLENFFGNMIPTDKPLHGRRYNNTIMFDVSAYEQSTHSRHLEILRRLGEIWEDEMNTVQLYSINKDKHNSGVLSTRDACLPFVRDSIAVLIVVLDV